MSGYSSPALRSPAIPASATDVGVEGNTRLTAVTGLLITVMLIVEGITILSIRGLISWHIFVGIALIGPVVLKSASTLYRFANYYRGKSPYVRRGPPHPILRITGPFVVLFTLAVLGTGLALLTVRPGDTGLWLTAHKATFIIWIALMTIHFLGHILEAMLGTLREIRPAIGESAVRGRLLRVGVVVAFLVAGVAVAAVVTPTATAWTGNRFAHDGGFQSRDDHG